MDQREIIMWRKALSLLPLLVVAILVCSCASSSKTTTNTFQHHQTLTSGVLDENDTLLFPSHIIVEQNLDKLDVSFRVTPHNMHVGDEYAFGRMEKTMQMPLCSSTAVPPSMSYIDLSSMVRIIPFVQFSWDFLQSTKPSYALNELVMT